MRPTSRLAGAAIGISLSVVLVTACGNSESPDAASEVPAEPTETVSAEVEADPVSEPEPSADPSSTPAESPTPFNPICGQVASPENYVAGEWSGYLRDDGDETRIVFTEECQVMEGDDIEYNNPDGEWSQRGGNVEFVLVMTLSDDLPNLYKGSLNAEGTLLTGLSENGVFQFTRVTPGQAEAPDPLADAAEGDPAEVAAEFTAQFEDLISAESRDALCEIYQDNEEFVRGPLATGLVDSLLEQGAQLSRGSREQYDAASYAYLEAICL